MARRATNQRALALQESDLDRSRGVVLVRRGKGGGAARSGWTDGPGTKLDPWLEIRRELPIGGCIRCACGLLT